MLVGRHACNVVRLKGDIYVFGGRDGNSITVRSVEKCTLTTTNHWNKIAEMPHLESFCACAFVDKIFILGGVSSIGGFTNACLQFDTNNYKFKNLAGMIEARFYAACAIFEEKNYKIKPIVGCLGYCC